MNLMATPAVERFVLREQDDAHRPAAERERTDDAVDAANEKGVPGSDREHGVAVEIRRVGVAWSVGER